MRSNSPTQTNHPSALIHHPHLNLNRHHISSYLSSVLTHMFAPVSCQSCTTSSCYHHHNEQAPHTSALQIIIDDEFVLLEEEDEEEEEEEEEEYGAPLCREGEIAAWTTRGRRGSSVDAGSVAARGNVVEKSRILERTPSFGERRRRLSFRGV